MSEEDFKNYHIDKAIESIWNLRRKGIISMETQENIITQIKGR